MKVHYINILLFAVPLNILVTLCHANTHKKPSITPRHIQTNRLLCECKLFAPRNYDNDPEMKSVMQQFHDRTTQRFQEYEESLQEKRQVCKNTCDKEIQKIILKDKIEKELNEKFSALHTDIQSDDIPTCICEKSLADKVEKGCLRCGSILGAAMPEVGSIGATALYTLCQWQTKAIATAIEKAIVQGTAQGAIAGIQRGKEVAIESLKLLGVEYFWPPMSNYILNMSHYKEVANLTAAIYTPKVKVCEVANNDIFENICQQFDIKIRVLTADSNYDVLPREALPEVLKGVVSNADTTAKAVAEAKSTTVAAEIAQQQTAAINATYTSWQIAITASVIAIVVIVLIMVIIYLILRYRRKKRMKKKLQYIKLLEE
ncbi:PIR protein, putative [Plasmodium sp.]|nr:PIR protein, putative [Plasmodium sp.]